MKEYNDEDLMIVERKQAEKQLPPSGELVQGMFFAVFSAKEYFESATLHFNKNKFSLAVSSFFHGCKELSKVKIAGLLFSWNAPQELKKYEKFQKTHSLKKSIYRFDLSFPISSGL